MTVTKFVLKLALLAFLPIAISLPGIVHAQSGEFLCSTGSRDGQPCNSDDDCPGGGVCVVSQGVCNGGASDGGYCDCPSGRCVSTPACSTDATAGSCSGGVLAGECCTVASNCDGNAPCVGTQKVCLGGTNQGASCLNNGQCPGSTCVSTGMFCDGGTNQDYSCASDADCPGGSCVKELPPDTPTPTHRVPTPTHTLTPIISAVPTRTRTPTTPGAPTRTRTPTTPGAPTFTATARVATPTAGSENSPTPTATAFAGPRLERDLTAAGVIVILDDGRSLPGDRATVQIDDEQIFYLIRDGNTLESLVRGVNGTTVAAHQRGTEVFLVEGLPTPTRRPRHTATPGPASVIYEGRGSGAGCAMTPSRQSNGTALLALALGFGFAWKRRR